MEWVLLVLLLASLSIRISDQQPARIRRDVARLDRKLNLILKHLNIPFENFPGLSDRVKELALDPATKIQAIKAYRDETGAGLKDAKDAVEDYIASLQR